MRLSGRPIFTKRRIYGGPLAALCFLVASAVCAPAVAQVVDVSDLEAYFVPNSAYVPADGADTSVVDTRPIQVPPAPPREAVPTREPAAPGLATPTLAASGGAPRVNPAPDRVISTSQQSADVVDQLAKRRYSPEQLQAVQKRVDSVVSGVLGGSGQGAPNADVFFDVARPGTGVDDATVPGRTRAAANGAYNDASAQDAQKTMKDMGSIPGGVVLDGAAVFGAVERLSYDARFNAFVLNDNTVYFAPVAPSVLALLCRAIQDDSRVGVSLGGVHVIYGKAPADSDLVLDLKAADHFLGDIVFASNTWTRGYRFAQGYAPQPDQSDAGYVAVFFKFTGFEFSVADGELSSTNAKLDIRLFPLTPEAAADGGLSPDYDAIAQGNISPQYRANAQHVAANVAYYRNEVIVDRMFNYGEAAAFLRGLRSRGFDLAAIAKRIEAPLS